ncbi:RNA polymerase sigma-E factor [Nocardioides dokdonensis FR1436]|uniref:RNA polymerase sigma-E factor n=1 Tax=Nocardioides dokdonensis FR1436 TaxID=1300347 RepID=A0A1A9GJW3_9ACTN|nr:SigE family RNA polymerase sigma factor [Nocardioides dokdonensis]ANH38627.1 RNA polymerase sigma-E factor [Nocardioides dokdonensis FR1436]
METVSTSSRPPSRSGRERPGTPRDGDFASFFAATWPRVYPVAVAVAGEHAAAEDALQSVFAKVYARWDRVQQADHPEAYVRRMVVNEVVGARRYGFARRERTAEQVPHDDRRASGSPEPGVVRRDEVLAALRTLPPRQRAVVVLRYYEDLSEAEIARTLGCSRGTVKSQASAALASLRRCGLVSLATDDEGDAR